LLTGWTIKAAFFVQLQITAIRTISRCQRGTKVKLLLVLISIAVEEYQTLKYLSILLKKHTNKQ